LEDFVADSNLLLGFRRQRDSDRVADPGPQQRADAKRGFDGPADQPAGLGYAKVKRTIDLVGELLVGGDGEEHVARLDRDLIVAEAVILEDPDMVERALHQGLGARLAILLEQILLEAPGVDPDADRAAVGAGRGD